jgi:lipoyl(octanoyl) transferase
MSRPHSISYYNLGRIRYGEAWSLQKTIHSRIVTEGIPGVLLINEHDHVYTLGKSGDENHLLAGKAELEQKNAEFFRIDRGGDITYHGPGQIVCYPILNLEYFRKDVHYYLRSLEDVIIRTLAMFDIAGERSEGETGVWVAGDKIAAIGIKVSRWVTMHGFAFNINTDLSYFGRIIPCGIFHKGVTSLAAVSRKDIRIDDVLPVMLDMFSQVFNVTLQEENSEQLRSIPPSNRSEQTAAPVTVKI